MKEIFNQLGKIGEIKILEKEPLSRHTTWKIGGLADFFIEIGNKEQLKLLLQSCHNQGTPFFIIGKGSNLLFSDSGFPGIIIKLSGQFNKILISEETLTLGAGLSIIKVANLAAKHGLSGLEFAGGIPASVGGVVCMNAGAHGREISQVLIQATILDEKGSEFSLTKGEMDFSYRSSILSQNQKWVVTEATLKLKKDDGKEIAKQMAENKKKRVLTQPYQHPTAGSVFKNPKSGYAGKLIEQSGLKGFQIGSARVSDVHCNFIVNTGHARATEIMELIGQIKEKVWQEQGVRLEEEVKIIEKRT